MKELVCTAPEGYTQPSEPEYFDGHDYEGFPGGCERMGCVQKRVNLLELIDNFAETRHTCGHWTYNLKSNESRQKVVAALKGNDLS
jgi:hypothetical protein